MQLNSKRLLDPRVRRWGVAGLLSCAVVLGACGPAERHPPSQPDARRAGPSPKLRDSVAAYLRTDSLLLKQVDSLYFGGGSVGVPPASRNEEQQAAVAGQAELLIEAMSDANRFRADEAHAGMHGAVVARLRRASAGNDPVFGTKSGPNWDYYVVVNPSSRPDTSTFFVLELNRANGRADSARVQGRAVTGMFAACPDRHGTHEWAAANFDGCNQKGTRASGAVTSRLRNFFAVQEAWAQMARGNGWLTCEFGCCELTALQ